MSLKEIDLMTSVGLNAPHPYAVLVSKSDTTINVMGISWFTFVSLKPGKIAFSISNRGYTNELIRNGADVTLCLPSESIKSEAFACGTRTGRGIDKAKELGIELVQVDGFAAPVVAGSAVAWCLNGCQNVDAGDHTLFIADIDGIVGDAKKKHLYALGGYKRLGIVTE